MEGSKLQVKAEFTETCPLAAWCPVILSFEIGMGATMLNYLCLDVCGLLHSLQWCSSVGCNSQSFSSGIPVWGSCNFLSFKFFQWHSRVHWTSQCTLAQGKGCATQLNKKIMVCCAFNNPCVKHTFGINGDCYTGLIKDGNSPIVIIVYFIVNDF